MSKTLIKRYCFVDKDRECWPAGTCSMYEGDINSYKCELQTILRDKGCGKVTKKLLDAVLSMLTNNEFVNSTNHSLFDELEAAFRQINCNK